ncbi:MAG: hypothetical protein WBD34_14210 [Burkholderiaceae bacterium]
MTIAADADRLSRALGYPYPVPDTSYLFSAGQAVPLTPEQSELLDLAGRLPVLAVGSNRSPEQLRRKFGCSATIPVTRFLMPDHDVAYCAYMTHYGSVPATLIESPGCCAELSITWLTVEQLGQMHDTESVGPHTWFGEIAVSPLSLGTRTENRVLTYLSARGLINRNGHAVRLSEIQATGRPATIATVAGQRDVLEAVWQQFGDGDFETWLLSLIADSQRREVLNNLMQNSAISAIPAGFSPIENIANI